MLFTLRLTATLFGLATIPVSAGDVPAFPGAEGFGAKASGGRGGKVIAVTNLNPSGPGTLFVDYTKPENNINTLH